jgi:hypothetical protein
MSVPRSLAEAWALEARERGATLATPGYDDAQNLFYAGAAAMLAMTAACENGTVLRFLEAIHAELKEYLEVA